MIALFRSATTDRFTFNDGVTSPRSTDRSSSSRGERVPSLAKLRCGLTGTVVETGSAETH